MTIHALFEGLVADEAGHRVDVVYVGDDPCYVVDDQGFRRHIPSVQVDRQVLDEMRSLIEGHEDLISQEAAKMLGQDDIFSIAMMENQLKQMDSQFETMLRTGIPEEGRAYLGMTGFQVVINVHGEVVEVKQPGIVSDE
ncbi:MAG: hypothetical protein R3293_26110 [Candidatus Promineifilaceae bacterium]|nr:hypothetical protein [Candidatus Promineifilaceae bacterium]